MDITPWAGGILFCLMIFVLQAWFEENDWMVFIISVVATAILALVIHFLFGSNTAIAPYLVGLGLLVRFLYGVSQAAEPR